MGEDQSFEALKPEKPQPSVGVDEDEDGGVGAKDEEEEEEKEEVDSAAAAEDEERSQLSSEAQRVEVERGDDAQLRTLEQPEPSSSLARSRNDFRDFDSSSLELLSEVPVHYDTESIMSAQFKDVLTSKRPQPFQALPQNKRLPPRCPISSSDFSPTSVIQPISSCQSATAIEQKVLTVPEVNSLCIPELNQKTLELKILSPTPVVRSPSSDGYNWRKYGQKQVKSPEGSRSYYKCTYSDCSAKKIGRNDHSSGVIEVIYKGQHNHEMPHKINCTRENRLVPHANSVAKNNTAVHSIQILNGSDASSSLKEPAQETAPTTVRKRQNSNGCDAVFEFKVEDEYVDEPEPKRREKKSTELYSSSSSKPGKKNKVVVRAASDTGISGDGYRWRKYGQKMVKGNTNPRNYYRCTSAGCPVRKHIETAVDNPSAVVIAYTGIHDHDMPVPKKQHGRLSASLIAAAAPTSMNNLQSQKMEVSQNEMIPKEVRLPSGASEIGDEKAVESTRTLLSIGFEIKPC